MNFRLIHLILSFFSILVEHVEETVSSGRKQTVEKTEFFFPLWKKLANPEIKCCFKCRQQAEHYTSVIQILIKKKKKKLANIIINEAFQDSEKYS